MMNEDGLTPGELATADQMVADANTRLLHLVAVYRMDRERDVGWGFSKVGSAILFAGQLQDHVRHEVLASVLTAALARLAADDE